LGVDVPWAGGFDRRGAGFCRGGGGAGAGTGVGSVGVDTVVTGGSSARAALEAKMPNTTPPARIKRNSGSRARHPVNERIVNDNRHVLP
jgi:hypothetical protein